jgi:hypothetical protein
MKSIKPKMKLLVSSLMLIGAASASAEVSWNSLLNAQNDPNNWLMYHQSFDGITIAVLIKSTPAT